MKINNEIISQYIDTAFYNRFYASLKEDAKNRFNIFSLRFKSENDEFDDFETQVVELMLLKHYFML